LGIAVDTGIQKVRNSPHRSWSKEAIDTPENGNCLPQGLFGLILKAFPTSARSIEGIILLE